MDRIAYDEYRACLKTGDIVLFGGNKGIGPLIKFLTRSDWSHVGMVVKDRNDILLWESMKFGKASDVEFNKEVKGVQMTLLSERIRKFSGKIAIRRLSIDFNEEMDGKLFEFRQKIKGRPYEKNHKDLLASALDFQFFKFDDASEDLSSLFCSELIAETYQELGLLSSDLSSSEYTPADFAEKRNLKLNGCTLGKEVEVYWNDSASSSKQEKLVKAD